MEIVLPPKLGATGEIRLEANIIVVVGANGAGKTRFGANIESRLGLRAHRIAAQKSLSMPDNVSPTSLQTAQNDFLYGTAQGGIQHKEGQRWGSKPATFLLNDYDKLMVLLHTEEYEAAIKFKDESRSERAVENPITKLDKIQIIWQKVLPHRKLTKAAGKIFVAPVNNPEGQYNASEMSDGERVIFYMIGEVVSVPENSVIIIDEPEMHIHKSITKKLWDEIEVERKDCIFIYLTHDIDFASSRKVSTKIWIKGYEDKFWDYEILEENTKIPDQLYLDILGSRSPILFIEGEDSSVDYQIFSLIFQDYTVKPLGSCIKVMEATKAFQNQQSFHHIKSYGLIDRDRRTEDEISRINRSIMATKVAEVENLLLLEDIVKLVAQSKGKDQENVFKEVKSNVINFFESQKTVQAFDHTASRMKGIVHSVSNSKQNKTITMLEDNLERLVASHAFTNLHDEILKEFESLISASDYEGILRVFNNKGVVPCSRVSQLCDLPTRRMGYLDYVVTLLKTDPEKSQKIREIIIQNIFKSEILNS